MGLELLPDGKTFQKLTAVQTRALDRYYIRLKKTNQEDLIKTALDNLPIILGATILGAAYVMRDSIKEDAEAWYEEQKENFITIVGGGTFNVVDFMVNFFRPASELWTGEPAEPDAPAEVVLPSGQTVVLTACERYEQDIVELYGTIPSSGVIMRTWHGIKINNKLDTMKKAGCTKPAGVPQRDWDRAT